MFLPRLLLLTILFLHLPPPLLKSLCPIRQPRLQIPPLVRPTIHFLHASFGGGGVGETHAHDTLGLRVEEDDVLDLAELGALLARVFDDVLGEFLVFLDLAESEHVLQDDDFVPAVRGGGQDGDVVFIPFCETSGVALVAAGGHDAQTFKQHSPVHLFGFLDDFLPVAVGGRAFPLCLL